MQLGSGSYDLKPRLPIMVTGPVALRQANAVCVSMTLMPIIGWATKPTGLGHAAIYRLAEVVRFDVSHQGKIDGQDSNITLPVQTAQTNFSGGTFANLSLGEPDPGGALPITVLPSNGSAPCIRTFMACRWRKHIDDRLAKSF